MRWVDCRWMTSSQYMRNATRKSPISVIGYLHSKQNLCHNPKQQQAALQHNDLCGGVTDISRTPCSMRETFLCKHPSPAHLRCLVGHCRISWCISSVLCIIIIIKKLFTGSKDLQQKNKLKKTSLLFKSLWRQAGPVPELWHR